MSRVLTDMDPQCSGLFRKKNTPQHPEVLNDYQPLSVDSSNFRVACKRQYLVELLHTHVMDEWIPLKKI